MSERPTFITPPSVGSRSRAPVTDETPNEILNLVRKRAQQASQYYHNVGLYNGDLPRNTPPSRSDIKRRSGSPEKRYEGVASVRATMGWSQPSTPVSPSPSKYGEVWVKPRPNSSPEIKEVKDNTRLYKTLPRKDRSRDNRDEQTTSKIRSRSSSQAANDNYVSTFQQSIPTSNVPDYEPVKFTIDLDDLHVDENDRNSTEHFNTVPCNTDDSNYTAASLGKSPDAGIPKTNGVSNEPHLPRVSSHLYQSKKSENKASAEFKVTYTLPSSKPRKDPVPVPQKSPNSSTDSTPKRSAASFLLERHRSNSDAHKDRKPTLSQSYDASDTLMPQPLGNNRVFGSTSSLDEMSNKHHDAVDGNFLELVHEYRKNKHSTHSRSISPTTKHLKKNQIDSVNSTPANSTGTSPKIYRRNKEKLRSKSDVPDHKTLLNKLTGFQNDRDSDLFRHPDLTFEQDRRRKHQFAHYDWQSMLFSFKDALVAMETLKRKNTPSGASKAAALAAAVSTDSLTSKGSSIGGSQEDVSVYDDEGLVNNKFNDIVASCPYFRNEIGGETDRVICISATGLSVQVGNHCDASTTQAQNTLTNHSYLSIVEHGSLDVLLPPGSPPSGSVSFGIENVDGGASYYRTHFFEKDHQNFFGVDDKYGPIVISFRREKMEDLGVYQYRIIIRTCELCTLRGSILEDLIATNRHTPSKGFPAKDVLEYVCSELNTSCLKVAVATPKVHEQIMKVDEQNVQKTYKIGVLFCRAGQATEEDMYNNENGSEAFGQFLDLLGKKIKLSGFEDFRGGLDVKTDSTGTESVFTTFNGYKIMFHVSTLLPFTPNNRQQLLRKRHIGNDITTIVFQEPGSEPFNPKYIRSHFQHVFVIVRVHNPCTENTCYSVAVTRSRNIPRFGPPIPENSMFPKSSTFREFLLTKLINGENTAHTAGKFKALAMNTREQYLRDLAVNSSTQYGLEGTPRFGRFSISAASRRIRENKDKQKLKPMPEIISRGALTWHITVDDYSHSEIVQCILGMSDCVLSIIEIDTRHLIFSIPCQAILGWTVPPPTQEQLRCYKRHLHIYYGRGERISLHTDEVDARDEIILRLERFTKGSETVYRQLRRNLIGELGFHVNYEGIVMEVEQNGNASMDGLKQSSRLVEICKVAVATMTHEEIIDLLRTSERVTVVVIPPNDNGTPRKCSMELYHLYPVLEVKKVNLSAALTPGDLSHERSRSEPVHKDQIKEKMPVARRISEDGNNLHASVYLYNDQNVNIQSKDFQTVKVRVTKPKLAKTSSGFDSKSTLATSATRLAFLGPMTGFTPPKAKKGDSQSQSSASNTLSSTKSTASSNFSGHSGADVDWTDNKSDETLLQSSNSLSSDSGMNSNNNSSYSSTLSHTSSNTPTSSNQTVIYDDLWGSRILHQNQNNNSMTPVKYQASPHYKRPRNEPPIKGVNWNPPKLPHSLDNSFTVECTPSSEVNRSLRVYIAGTDAYKKSKLNQSQSTDSKLNQSQDKNASHEQSRSEPTVSTPTKWRNQPVLASRSILEMTKKPFTPTKLTVKPGSPKAKRRGLDLTGSKLKGGSKGRSSPFKPPASPIAPPTPTSNDLQSSLIRLLTAESPTKQPTSSKRTSPVRKSPARSASQRTSPKRRPSPIVTTPKSRAVLQRTMSDESLCGARTDEIISARQGSSELLNASCDFYGHPVSGSVDSLAPIGGRYNHQGASPVREPSPIRGAGAPTLLPLPDTSDSWDRILDAAKAAEVFEASSIRSASMGTLNELTDMTPDLPNSVNRKQRALRTMSVEHLYDHEYRGNQGDPANLLRKREPLTPNNNSYSHHSVTSQSLSMTKQNESELRLEKIEREMMMLQNKLKKEQESKKVLEEEVTSLRRDNTRLLRHVRDSKPDPMNGFKRTKRKSKS